jgi:hypothetical protein
LHGLMRLTRTLAVQAKLNMPEMAMIGPLIRHCSGSTRSLPIVVYEYAAKRAAYTHSGTIPS